MPTPLLHEGSCQPPSPPRLRQMRCTVGSLPWLSLASHVIVLSGPLPSPRETPLRPQAPEPVSSVPLPNPAKLQGLSPHPTPCSLSAVIRGGSLVTRDLGCCVCVRALVPCPLYLLTAPAGRCVCVCACAGLPVSSTLCLGCNLGGHSYR